MKSQINLIGLSLVAAAALVACGGGGGSSSIATPTSFSGTVIDGYIEGATVCLDLNGDQACGAGEPTAISKTDGTYSLDTSGLTTAQIAKAHLLTIVPLTAKDADDAGKTLAQAGKSAFNLMAPASAFVAPDGTLVSAVISPLTTLVSHDMIAGNSKPLADSVIAVQTRMGLAANSSLIQNFVGKTDQPSKDLQLQAQVVAAVLGEVKKAALGVTGTSDRDALLAALTYLQQNVKALTADALAQRAVDSKATPLSMVQASFKKPALALVTKDLIGEAQKFTTSTDINVTALLQEGFYALNFSYPCSVLAKCPTVNYTKWDGNASQWFATSYQETASSWLPSSPNINDLTLTAKGWINKGFGGMALT